MKPIASAAILALVGGVVSVPARGDEPRRFAFAPHLALNPPGRTLNVGPAVIEGSRVRINGGDSAQPAKPFLIDWGDGKQTESWFPAAHTYARSDRNYVIKVTARYRRGEDTVPFDVRFVLDRYEYKRDRAVPRRVFIPRTDVALGSTMLGYRPPAGTSCFRDDEITPIPRDVIEYVLDVGHHIQLDLCNGNVTAKAADRQVVLKQTAGGGASLWFTDPVSFVCHPAYLTGSVDLSSLLHELAHNLTLNSPARYRFGGKIDGPMNTIVSETLAQAFQHATIHTILNASGRFGLSDDVGRRLEENAIASIGVVREAYRRYLADPSRYTTYNDPATPDDDTFDTFMTVAYVFCEHAEQRSDYRKPLKRMMRLMQTFHEADHKRFQQRENESFRATFLVAAMAYGFDADLRARFRRLNFPVSDATNAELVARMD